VIKSPASTFAKYFIDRSSPELPSASWISARINPGFSLFDRLQASLWVRVKAMTRGRFLHHLAQIVRDQRLVFDNQHVGGI